jgi:hypothetical protein
MASTTMRLNFDALKSGGLPSFYFYEDDDEQNLGTF